MAKYSKLIAAAIGLLALVSKDVAGVEIGSETVDKISEGIVALLSLVAVYGVTNK